MMLVMVAIAILDATSNENLPNDPAKSALASRAVMMARIHPTLSAQRNNALSFVLEEVFTISTNQNTKNPGAKEDKEMLTATIKFSVRS